MSYASKVLYAGDGSTTQFNVSFPFISSSHVNVYVNETLQIDPLMYTLSGTQVTFSHPPEVDDAIWIKRRTSPNDLLVDFHDGSVLNEADLDMQYQHNFYLMQEGWDSYNELINNALLAVATGTGIVETETDEIIDALVAEMLNHDSAAVLQASVADIDNNAEAIIDLAQGLQTQINTLAQGVASVVYVQDDEPIPGEGEIPDPIVEGARWYDSNDNNHPYIYLSSNWEDLEDPRIGVNESDITALDVRVTDNEGDVSGHASAITVLDATVITLDEDIVATALAVTNLNTEVDDNAAAIVTEASTRSDADTASATLIALIGAENGAQNAFILDTSTVKIDSDSGDTFATRLSALATADSDNAALVATEESARISADEAEAALRVTLAARVTVNEGDIDTAEATIVSNKTIAADASGANASLIDTLDSRVEGAEGDIATNATATSELSTTVDTFDGAITANASDITQLETDVTAAEGTISAHTSAIAAHTTDIAVNEGETLVNAQAIDALDVRIGDNEGDISGQATAISGLTTDVGLNEDGIIANALDVTNLTASVGTIGGDLDTAELTIAAHVTAINNNDTDIADLYAHYGVTLDVNDYITGFSLNNDGETGAFVIVADSFGIVDPTTFDPKIWWDGETETLQIDGDVIVTGTINGVAIVDGGIGVAQMGNNSVDTAQLNADAVNADKIEAGVIIADHIFGNQLDVLAANTGTLNVDEYIKMDAAGYILGGQTAFNTGSGFFLGYESGEYVFSIGDSTSGNYLTWDGSELVVKGDLVVGEYELSDTIILSATTERSDFGHEGGWETYKTFTIAKDGDVRIVFEAKVQTNTDVITPAQYQITVNNVQVELSNIFNTTYSSKTEDLTGLSAGDVIDINLTGGEWDTGDPTPFWIYIRNVYVKADVVIAPGGSVDLD